MQNVVLGLFNHDDVDGLCFLSCERVFAMSDTQSGIERGHQYEFVMGVMIGVLRIKSKMSQSDLAKRLEISQSCLSRMERGGCSISVSEMVAASITFNRITGVNFLAYVVYHLDAPLTVRLVENYDYVGLKSFFTEMFKNI